MVERRRSCLACAARARPDGGRQRRSGMRARWGQPTAPGLGVATRSADGRSAIPGHGALQQPDPEQVAHPGRGGEPASLDRRTPLVAPIVWKHGRVVPADQRVRRGCGARAAERVVVRGQGRRRGAARALAGLHELSSGIRRRLAATRARDTSSRLRRRPGQGLPVGGQEAPQGRQEEEAGAERFGHVQRTLAGRDESWRKGRRSDPGSPTCRAGSGSMADSLPALLVRQVCGPAGVGLGGLRGAVPGQALRSRPKMRIVR